MSVLVKNMDMPSMCSCCPMISETGVCMAEKELREDELDGLWTKEERPSWCPLVEIPTHGEENEN